MAGSAGRDQGVVGGSLAAAGIAGHGVDDAGGMLEHALHTPETTARDDRGLDAIGGLNVRGGSGDDHGVFRGAQRRGSKC